MLLSVAGLASVRAETLFTLSGWIQRAERPYSDCGKYVIKKDPLDRVRAILTDPEHRFGRNLPDRCALRVVITQSRGPGDEPVFRIVAQDNAALTPSSPDAAGSESWTALTGDLYATAMNVVPRLASFIGDDYSDADGDGQPNSKDTFPCRPEEWLDTDHDGTGNNADPDDDNDGMSDQYELLTGLNPLVADADGDADGDGVTNGQEARAGTLANDRTSFFALTIGADSATRQLTVHWQSLTTRIYILESATALSGPWQLVFGPVHPVADGILLYSTQFPAGAPLFFRATASTP